MKHLFVPLVFLLTVCFRLVPEAMGQTFPATVVVDINQGAAQRSALSSISVVFSEDVGAFLVRDHLFLRNLTTGQVVDPLLMALNYEAVARRATWTFPGAPAGSLPEANYLVALRSVALFPPNTARTEQSPGLGMADTVLGAFRFFGDSDGDRDIDFLDAARFRKTLNQPTPAPDYDASLDVDRDGNVSAVDETAFAKNYFTLFPRTSGVYASLFNDTGINVSDGLTSDITIAGMVLRKDAATGLRATLAPVGAQGTSAPVDATVDVGADGSFRFTPGRLSEFAGAPLGAGSYRLLLESTDGGLASGSHEVQFTLAVDCDLVLAAGWKATASAPPRGLTSPVLGSVQFAGCEALLTEGDSFQVTLERSFIVPPSPGLLAISYEAPSFDGTSTRAMRDAFEAALVDASGLPLTLTIQGEAGVPPASSAAPPSLPASPDAFFNHSDGKGPFAAPGAVSQAATPTVGLSTVFCDVSSLPPGSSAHLILRLVNNDGDRASAVRITKVEFKPANPALDLAGSPPSALSLLTAPDSLFLPSSSTSGLTFGGSAGGGLTVTSASPMGPATPPNPPQTAAGDSILPADGRLVFTTTEEFQRGTLFNVNTTEPSGDLRLNTESVSYPFIWIANSGEGTLSKFDTSNGKEIARYRTGPENAATRLSPSRTSVDAEGNGWVANRGTAGPGGDLNDRPGTVVKVLGSGFIDRNGNGLVDTSRDLNSDGRISSNELLRWDANRDGQPDDERIALVIQVGRVRGNTNTLQNHGVPRSMAIDARDDLWVGLWNLNQYEVYDGRTGRFLALVPTPVHPYGAVIDSQGRLWGSTNDSGLTHINTVTRRFVENIAVGPTYGITIDSDDVVWMGNYQQNLLVRYDPRTRKTDNYPMPAGVGKSRGLAVDLNRNVWVAADDTDRMVKFVFAPDHRTLLSTASVPVGDHPAAAAIDADGYVWTTTRYDDRAWKINANTNRVIFSVPTGDDPYNYSDMTGRALMSIVRQGTWTEITDSLKPGTVWGAVGMDAFAPAGTSIRLQVRASDSRAALPSVPELLVVPGQPLPAVVGQFLEVKVTLDGAANIESPSVREIAIYTAGPPLLTVHAPARSFAPGTTVLLSGNAAAFQPQLTDGSYLPNAITYVQLGSSAVPSLDGQGNFFVPVTISPGQNDFTFTAADLFSQTATVTLTLTGSDPDNSSDLGIVSASVVPEYGRTSFHEATRTLYADLALSNSGTYPIRGPFYVGVTRISEPSVSLLGADGVSSEGTPYYDFTATLTAGSLLPASSSAARSLAFYNPNRLQFSYELVVLGQSNNAPVFTSTPPLEGVPSRAYSYPAKAVDPDGDSVSYVLAEFPAGMSINIVSGVISWTPTISQIGTHNVRVQADDGKGGTAEQQFIVTVTTAPPNRPPFFVSTPVTVATVSAQTTPAEETFDLSKWSAVQIPIGEQPPANWVISANNTVATQTVNADPSVMLSDIVLENSEIRGSWQVGTNSGDDDYMGFVFGYQDAQHFYLFDWKRGDQNDCGGLGEQGMSVKVVSVSSPLQCEDLWPTAGRSDRVRTIFHNGTPWTEGVAYEFQLNVTDGAFSITVRQAGAILAQIDLNDDTYRRGKFGFYNNSQGPVTYTGFTRRSVLTPTYDYDSDALDPDADVLNYSLVASPTGMTINAASGAVSWSPTVALIGTHDVTIKADDGRGGTTTQSYRICVLPNDGPPPFTPPNVDLTVTGVNPSGVQYDANSLAVTGNVTAQIANTGTGTPLRSFEVLFFEDVNRNGAFEPALDNRLGSQIAGPLAGGSSATITASLAGLVRFAGSPVWAFVDSQRAIPETSEANNIGRPGCDTTPVVGQFNPVIEWKQDTFVDFPASKQVMMTPAVADLNADGMPEVIFGTTASLGGGNVEVGVLRAVKGDGSSVLFTVTDPRYEINTASSVAVGDIDGDNRPEIVACDASGSRLIAFENDGKFKWRSPSLETINWGAPSLADLDHDGRPEVVIGRQVLNSDGTLRWSGTGAVGSLGGLGPLSLVADVNTDGSPDIVAGNTVYSASGGILWRNAQLPDGANAIGNFDDDATPEIVLVSDGNIWLVQHTGAVKWGPVSMPGGGGGAPTVGDFDGDGRPEIGVAGASRYVVFETDGSIKWQATTQDSTSYKTASSVFDFDGDGSAEVVYRDELYLRIYRGKDGIELFRIPMSSCTWYEYVVIVDVDADGNAEIVAAANQNCGFGPQSGIFVIGDRNDTWVSTRKIWNQHSYHITNVNDDGTIPRVEANSWQTHNTYRLNALPEGGELESPDLTASFARRVGTGPSLTVTMRIGNGGTAVAPAGLPVALYNGNPRTSGTFLKSAATVAPIQPGAFEDLAIVLPDGNLSTLWIVADDDGTGRGRVRECDEANNFYQPGSALPAGNQPPVLTSSPVLTVIEGITWTYDVEATDPDAGDTISYSLASAPAGMTISAITGLASWSPGPSDNGPRIVQVAAMDSRGARTLQIFTLAVSDEVNASPLFVSTPPANATAAQAWYYFPAASDPDRDELTFDVVNAPSGMELDSDTLVWRPLLSQLGSHEVTLRVQDGRSGVALQSFTVTVTAPNSAPVFTTQPPGPAVAGKPWRYFARAQDGEGQSLMFSLADPVPAGLTLKSQPSTLDSTVLEWTPSVGRIGANPITLVVRDSDGLEARQVFNLQVTASAQNTPPVFTSTPRTQTRLGLPWLYLVEATDADGDPLAISLVTGPDGMAPENTQPSTPNAQLFHWTPSAAQSGAHNVVLRVTDGRGGSVDQTFTLSVGNTMENAPPLITSNPPPSATAGQPYEYDLAATDPDGDAIAWRLLSGPVGLSLDAATGAVRWSPTLDQLGNQTVAVEASDGFFGIAEQKWTVDVGCVNRPPAITSAPATLAQTGDPYLYAPRASDPDGDRLSWSLTAKPAGMTIDALTGLLRWTPAAGQLGATVVTLKILDGRGGSDTQTYTLTTGNLRANRPPVIVTTPNSGTTAGRPYAYNLRATDSDGDLLTLSLLVKPAGAVIAPNVSGRGAVEGTVTWTPAAGVAGPQEFIVVATDTVGASASQRFFVTVRPNEAPVITSSPRTSGAPGVAYRYDVLATDANDDSLNYVLGAGPAAMSVDSLGRMTWTPAIADIGTHPVTVKVTDGFGGEATQSFTVTVAADTEKPIVNLIVSYNLADAQGNQFVRAGTTVPVRVTATDDVGVVAQSLTLNGVSVALNADGSGMASFPTAGSVPAVAEARDASGNSAQFTTTIPVADPNANSTVTITLHNPADGDTLTKAVDVVGTITGTAPLSRYSVEFAEATAEAGSSLSVSDPSLSYQTLAQVSLPPNTLSVTNAVLGKFDPTLLQNSGYVIRVTAFDINGKGRQEGVLVNLTGNLKLGEFRLEFTDLTVPLVGIPITVTRIYDSRDSRRQGDFGYGWSLGLRDARILEVGKLPYSGLSGETSTFTTKSRVYLTGPDGRRVGFNFTPQEAAAGLFVAYYRPAFTADPGVYDKLEVVPAEAAYQIGVDGSFTAGWGLGGFDPTGYRLTTRDNLIYDYDQSFGLQRITDLNGNTVTFTAGGIIHSSGAEIKFTRDSRGRITKITDPAGKDLAYTYDAAGDLTSFTDRTALTTQFRYMPAADRPHYLQEVIDPLGRRAVRTEYGPDGRVTAVIDALGNRQEQSFTPEEFTGTRTDARGNQTVLVYNDRGNVTEERDPEGGVKKFEYADPANPDKETAIVDQLGRRTGLAYDARGNLTRQTDPNGKTTAVTYTALNKPASVINALGQRVSLHYDANGHLDEVTDNAGNKRQMVRDAQGRVTSIMDAEGHVTRLDYTTGCPCGRPGKIIHPDGSFRLYEYNAFGQVTKETDETGVVTRSEYDAEGKLKYTEDAFGHRTTYTYRGTLQETVTNPLGHVTRTEYDDANRQIAITDAEGGIVRFEYDADGNRKKVIDPVGNVTTFVYDKLGRLNEEINTLGHKRVHSYDSVGNRTETIDRNGRRRTFEFDALNRMTQEKWWDNTNAVIRTLEYAFNDLGLQTLAADPAARYDYTYDTLNRLRSVKSAVPGLPDFTLTYAYDKNGQTTSVTDNYGVSVGSRYDSRNRLHSRTWQGPGINPARVGFDYDNAGRRTRLDRFNNLTGTQRVGFTTIGYDNGGVVADITHRGPAQQVQARHEYKFDSAYQMKSWTINNESSAFEYDRTGQLTNTLGAVRVTESFRYDSNGSRMDLQSDGMYSVKGNNLIASDGPNRYDYDREGNMTSRVNTSSGILTTYQWDHRNRLTAVVDIDSEGSINQTVAFVYDAVNRRLAKTVTSPDGTYDSRFLYNQEDAWADLDGAHTITARYLHGPQIDELISRQLRTDGNAWYLTDHLGTVRDIAKDDGVVAAHAEYSSFGNVLSTSDPFLMGRFGFAGREWDAESGLLQMRSRYYNPQMGRFVSEDPIGFKSGDINLLRYVGNSPVNSRDPYGLSAMLSYSLGVKDVLSGGPSTSINNYALPGAMVGLVHGYGLTSIVFMSEFLRDGNIRDALVRTELQMTAIKEEACDSAKRLGGGPKFQQGKVGGFVGGFCTGIESTLSIKLFGHELLPEDVGYGGFDQGVSLGLKYLRGVFGQGQ